VEQIEKEVFGMEKKTETNRRRENKDKKEWRAPRLVVKEVKETNGVPMTGGGTDATVGAWS
jgi:hypothetical protein